MQFKIYNYIDEERKYYGFTLIEIISFFGCILCGFIFNSMLFGGGSAFFSVLLVRYVKEFLRASSFLRRMYFHSCDLVAVRNKRTNIHARYYL